MTENLYSFEHFARERQREILRDFTELRRAEGIRRAEKASRARNRMPLFSLARAAMGRGLVALGTRMQGQGAARAHGLSYCEDCGELRPAR